MASSSENQVRQSSGTQLLRCWGLGGREPQHAPSIFLRAPVWKVGGAAPTSRGRPSLLLGERRATLTSGCCEQGPLCLRDPEPSAEGLALGGGAAPGAPQPAPPHCVARVP